MSRSVLLILFVFTAITANAQVSFPDPCPVYCDTVVARIDITISPDSLAQLYHPDNWQSDHEYPAAFRFDNGIIVDSVENIGFRLRGNTSREAQKKSFKVSFNTFVPGRKFYGLEKLNLNGEHNDPSIIRAKLSWDIFRKMQVPASRSSYAAVYINNNYYGLYINVEHIDENFVKSRFGNNDGNLYKCLWPADLKFISGYPDDYKFEVNGRRAYDLKINEDVDDYSDLAAFIEVLNLTPINQLQALLEQIFNVNQYLRIMAVDAAVSSWDNYWFLKNNYYLYHNLSSNKFEFIPYDYDNSFGIWWDGIYPNIDWGYRNVYTWGHPNEDRPLANRILSIPEYRERYTFYLKKAVNIIFNADSLNPAIDRLHTLITPSAEADLFRTYDYGYTITDFHNSYTTALGGHVTYGLKPYVAVRSGSILSQADATDVSPIISDIYYSPRHPNIGDPIRFYAIVEDEDANPVVELRYQLNGIPQTAIPFSRTGTNQYSTTLPALSSNSVIHFNIFAQDNAGQQSLEPLQPWRISVGFQLPELFINEFMAYNSSTIADTSGSFADWIELFNADTIPVWLGDKYLSDDLADPTKWQMPDTVIQPGDFMFFWVDDDEEQGPHHANFKLDKDGEQIGIFHTDSSSNAVIDSITFGVQQTDVSMGRMPDGGPTWQFFSNSTPGISNLNTAIEEKFANISGYKLYHNYPNPFNAVTSIKYFVPVNGKVTINIFNVLGQNVALLFSGNLKPGEYINIWNAENFPSGIYFINMVSENSFSQTRKIILLK